jgi:hypothetical protein
MPTVKCIKAPKLNSLRADEVLEVGKTYEMTDDSANRWIRRGVVAVVTEPVKTKGKADEPKADGAAGGKPGHAG